MKASDISDVAMLESIRRCSDGVCGKAVPMRVGGWSFVSHEQGRSHWELWPDLCEEFPDMPPKVVLAKAAKLIKRGFIDGCPCGCRGDFEMKDSGRAFLNAQYPSKGGQE